MSTCIAKIEFTDNQFYVTRFYVMLKYTITYPMYPNLHKGKETVVLSGSGNQISFIFCLKIWAEC